MPTSAMGLVRLIMIRPSWQDRARAPLSRDAKFFGISDTYERSGLATPTQVRGQGHLRMFGISETSECSGLATPTNVRDQPHLRMFWISDVHKLLGSAKTQQLYNQRQFTVQTDKFRNTFKMYMILEHVAHCKQRGSATHTYDQPKSQWIGGILIMASVTLAKEIWV